MLHYLLKCCLLNCSGECISFSQEARALIFPLHLLWAVCFLVHSVSSDVTDPPRGKVEVLAVERGRDSSQQLGHCPPVTFWRFMGLFLVFIMNWGKATLSVWGHGAGCPACLSQSLTLQTCSPGHSCK